MVDLEILVLLIERMLGMLRMSDYPCYELAVVIFYLIFLPFIFFTFV